jgi:HEAT repeat protein
MLEISPAILSDPPDPSRLSRSSPAELMRLLHHSNWRVAARAAGVLKRRDSFRTEHLRLAYDLFHPETARRKAVISHLSRLPNVNMVPWIMILMDDPEAEVRMAAIGYAATCQNSKIREIAARKAEADDHPDIRKMAAMIDRRAQ